MLVDRYDLVEELGSGSFGAVYLAIDKTKISKNCKINKNYDKVAVKVENKKNGRLFEEYKTYKILNKNGFVNGIPKVYEYLETQDNNILVMELLGKDLDELFSEQRSLFGVDFVKKLGYKITELLEQLHNSGFIHRDIKPNNFMLDSKNNPNNIYIMDFGLSKRYRINNRNKHIKFRSGRTLIGTARYVSCNMHMGIEPSRRDDLESVAYMLIYFVKGNLPWQGLKKISKNLNLEAIGEIKISTRSDVLCNGLPSCFKMYLDYCKSLGFYDEPNYDYLKGLFLF